MDLSKTFQLIADHGVSFGLILLGVIAIWIIGRLLIGMAVRLATSGRAQQSRCNKKRVTKIPNVVTTPALDVAIMEINGDGPLLLVRPYCHNSHYWRVHADTNKAIKETL